MRRTDWGFRFWSFLRSVFWFFYPLWFSVLFFFKHPVFGFYRKRKTVFRFFFFQLRFLISRPFFVHVARRHPGDVPGESGPQKAVEVLRNFIAIGFKIKEERSDELIEIANT